MVRLSAERNNRQYGREIRSDGVCLIGRFPSMLEAS
jgi:hypothetical protein